MYPMTAHHFVTPEQQSHAQRLGTWAFIASEILLFGGLFTAYTAYRLTKPAAFAEASPHLYQSIAITNTAILLISSLTMALAVHAAKAAATRLTASLLAATAALGLAFLILKAFEYRLDYTDAILPGLHFDPTHVADPPAAARFFLLYLFMTGLHALHLTAAVILAATAATLAATGRFKLGPTTILEPLGLYWHFVDVLWVFLLPLLYFIK
jgi:cytochrome c oxidase subunit 3